MWGQEVTVAGYCIPEKVIAVCRPTQVYTRAFTDEKIEVRATWVVDAESDKMLVRAKDWAKFDPNSRRKVSDHNPDCYPQANDAMDELRLVGIDHRQEGGVAYKVVTPQGYLVDLREDEFLEAVFEGRLMPDGTIVGEYIWSRGGSQMRIVRVGSTLYEERLEAGGRAGFTKIPPKDLVVGHMYRGKDPNTYHNAVFIGRVRYQGKLMFAWRSYYPNNPEKVTPYCEITQGHSYVEDLGPCPYLDSSNPREGITNYSRGGWSSTRFDPADLEWL